MKKSKKGFTLVELLVVIAIIGLLSTLAVVALNSAREKSRDAKRVADIKQVQTALELYFNDENRYPVGTAIDLGQTGNTVLSSSGWASGGSTTYMGLVPKDPQTATDGSDAPCVGGESMGATECDYSYSLGGSTDEYYIYFLLEANTGGLTGGSVCATEAGVSATCVH